MMKAPIELTLPFLADCTRLNLSKINLATLSAHLTIAPLRLGRLLYRPLEEAFKKQSRAGLYEADIELRNDYGVPFGVRVRYIFTHHTVPLLVVGAMLLTATQPPTALSHEDLATVDSVVATLARQLA